MFIVIEGIDGVGKSTIAKHLAESLDAVFYRTPPEDYLPIRELINNCNNRDAQLYYYLSSVFYASTKIQKLLEAGNSVVCDRYYYTTLVTYANILSETYSDFWQTVEQLTNRFCQPDFAFLLTLSSIEERKKRLNNRGFISPDDIASLNEDEFKQNMAIYQKFNLIEICTDGLAIEDILINIKNTINLL